MSNEEVVGGKTKDEIKSIDLFVTEQCNMNCDYCFHPKTEAVLTVDQGKKILDRMKELSPAALQITFFGGEPLLYPHAVIELAQYARELWPPDKEGRHTSTLSISTNGMFFDESVFKKFAELGMAVQVSCDGDEITHTEYRHGDYKRIIENIKKILAIKPDVSVRMTFTPKTVGRLAINVQYLHELGITKIMHHAVMEEDWTDEAVEQYRYQLGQIYHYRRYCKRQGIPLEIAFIDKPLKIVNDEVPPEKEYCQAGKTYLAILDNGDVYPSDEARMLAEMGDEHFRLGSVLHDSYEDVMSSDILLDTLEATLSESLPMCHDCGFMPYCGTDPIYHYETQNDVIGHKALSGFCNKKYENLHQVYRYLKCNVKERIA